jgi:hypothetical protein
MNLRRLALTSLAALAVAAPAFAEDANFVIRLGQDTTAVERYSISSSRIEVRQVGRSPRTMRRQFVYELDKSGAFTKFSMVVTPPASDTATQTITGVVEGDSVRSKVENAGQPARNVTSALPKGGLIATVGSPWGAYQLGTSRLAKAKGDSLRTSIYFIGGTDPSWVRFQKRGAGSMSILNERGDEFLVKVDKDGKILSAEPTGGTFKISAERVAKLDVDAMTQAFVAKEKASGGMGALSPRDSVKVEVGGANLYVDYSRPAKRGRVVMGALVPYGQVWRTGANSATQFRTDKPLDFGGKVVPAGFYTLWTLPSLHGWKLMFNSQTGQWGTEHDPARDVVTIDMLVDDTLTQPVEKFTIGIEPIPDGGVLYMDWDTTRALARFKVGS